MANWVKGKSLESRVKNVNSWKPVPGYTDKFGKPLKFARIHGKPSNTGHFLYITANHSRTQIERMAAENLKREDEKRQKAAVKQQKQAREDERLRRDDEMEKAGFGKEAYFIAQQLWRAENARHGTNYLFYKNDLKHNDPNFKNLPEADKIKAVKAHIKNNPNLDRKYYEQVSKALRPLGYVNRLDKEDKAGIEHYGSENYWNTFPRYTHQVLGLRMNRDPEGNSIPMDNPAPALTKEVYGVRGFPIDYGSGDQRWKAYQEWKTKKEQEDQAKQGAFNQYMGSINLIV